MSRFIDVEAPIAKFCSWLDNVYEMTEGGQWDDGAGAAIAECVQELRDTPTADVAPVVHAHWIPGPYNVVRGGNDYKCSNCGRKVYFLPHGLKNEMEQVVSEFPYCNCGAKMEVQNE